MAKPRWKIKSLSQLAPAVTPEEKNANLMSAVHGGRPIQEAKTGEPDPLDGPYGAYAPRLSHSLQSPGDDSCLLRAVEFRDKVGRLFLGLGPFCVSTGRLAPG